jgi:prephenate dehydrogenase
MGDDGSGFFADKHVAIFGLGLMGGSLALSLQGKCRLLTGIDSDPATIQTAINRGIVDRGDIQPGVLLGNVDLIILAAPVKTILALLGNLPDFCQSKAVVMDLGSTKLKICEAMQKLPGRFDPIGGHPMCGKETSGLENADPSMFQDATFAFIPLERTTTFARQCAEELASQIGSQLLWLDATTHDQQVAATSHLPYLAANALAFCTPINTSSMAATGFSSTTRLAATSPTMMMDVLQTNREAILSSLHRYNKHLAAIEKLMTTGEFDALYTLLAQGSENRNKIVQTGEIL